jgi:uncharacterized protein DUF2829
MTNSKVVLAALPGGGPLPGWVDGAVAELSVGPDGVTVEARVAGPAVAGDRPVTGPGPGMDFGAALAVLKAGGRVTRAGWNGKGMFLYLVPGSVFTVNRPPLDGIYPPGTEITYRPHIDMKTADGSCVPWLASQSDLLEADWVAAGDGE